MKKTTTNSIVLLVLLAVVLTGWLPTTWAADPSSQTSDKSVSKAITDEQKTQLRTILQKYESTIGPLMKQYNEEKNVLNQLMHAKSIDEAALRAQFTKAAAIGADITIQRALLLNKMRGVLTAEQLQTFKQVESDLGNTMLDSFLFRVAGPGSKN